MFLLWSPEPYHFTAYSPDFFFILAAEAVGLKVLWWSPEPKVIKANYLSTQSLLLLTFLLILVHGDSSCKLLNAKCFGFVFSSERDAACISVKTAELVASVLICAPSLYIGTLMLASSKFSLVSGLFSHRDRQSTIFEMQSLKLLRLIENLTLGNN